MSTWRERIAAARNSDGFTCADKTDARHVATCAVGEQLRSNPVLSIYSPAPGFNGSITDLVLSEYGFRFNDAVTWNAFDLADLLLDQIEDRVLTLKREAQP